MNRRRLLIAAGALLAPRLPWAQAARVHRVAWLSTVSKAGGATFLAPFVEGMAALGYVLGKNLELDECWGDNSLERLKTLALEAAARAPAVFVTQGPALQVTRDLPGTAPVVFGNSGDPIEAGFAQSMARPGGRHTGITFLSYALVGKRVEFLREVAPKARRLAVLSNPQHSGDAKELAATREAAVGVGFEVSHYPATNPGELQRACAAAAAGRAEAVVIHPDGLMLQQRIALARFFLEHRLPTISGWAAIAEGGTLMTYGPVLQESYRRLAYFVDRILRGAKPAELPIEFPQSVELVINLATAKALGLVIPPAVRTRASRVIE